MYRRKRTVVGAEGVGRSGVKDFFARPAEERLEEQQALVEPSVEAHDHRRGAEAGSGSARRFLEHALENGRKSFGGGKQTRGEAAPVLVLEQLLLRKLRIRMRMLAVPGGVIIPVGLKLCSRWTLFVRCCCCMQFIQVPRSIFDECVELLKISGVEVMEVAVEALGRERTPTQPIHERDALHGIIAARLPGWMEGAGSGIGGWNLAPTPSYTN